MIPTYITLKEIEQWLFWNSIEWKEEICEEETFFFKHIIYKLSEQE